MPKLGVAFLGMTVGGVTFLVMGLATYLTISQIQDRTMEARAPTTQQTLAQYAQVSNQR